MLAFWRFSSWHVEFLRVDLGLSSIRSRVVCRHFLFSLNGCFSRSRRSWNRCVSESFLIHRFVFLLARFHCLPPNLNASVLISHDYFFSAAESPISSKSNSEFRSPWWRSNLVSFQAYLQLFCVRLFCRIDSVSWSLFVFFFSFLVVFAWICFRSLCLCTLVGSNSRFMIGNHMHLCRSSTPFGGLHH